MKKTLNVCLMNDSFPPTIDGVANTVFNYANIIQEKYGNVTVATPEYPNVIDDYSFDVIRYPSFDTTKLIGYRCGMPFDNNTITNITNKNIDIIHSHCPVASTLLARVVRNSIEKPIVFTYHTKFDIDIKNATKSKILQNLAINSLVANIESCDDVWVVSKGAGENLKSLGYTKDYIVMPNGVDFEKGKSLNEEIEAIKKEYHLRSDIPTYLFVGRMMWYKGIKIILDALNAKKQHNQDFRMLFIGDGIECQEIKDYTTSLKLDDKCIFAGAVRDRAKLKAIFSACDIFLFPSTFDTNGIVVREAAAAGLGTILIKGSCAAEETIDGQNVIQIEENAESLAKILIEAGNNTDFFHTIGKNAQNEIYMSWDESIAHAYDRYIEISDKYQFDKKKMIKEDGMETFFAGMAELNKGLQLTKEKRKSVQKKSLQAINEVNGIIGDTMIDIACARDITKARQDEIKQFLEEELDRYL